MRSRPLAVVSITAVLLLTACSGGDTVPDDQVLVPASAPDGWVEHDVAGVSFATPPEWEELELPDSTEGTARVGFADQPSSSGSTGGIVVMVLPEGRFPAKTQAQTFLTSAKNREQASDDNMEQVVWPASATAWYVSYTAQVGEEPHPTAHLVLDLKNGYQVQATVRAQDDSRAAEHLQQALSTVRPSDGVAVPDDA